MGSDSSLRNLYQLIDDLGLSVVGLEKGKHYKVLVQAKDGRRKKFIHGVSLSDHRAMLNVRADYRRFARGG